MIKTRFAPTPSGFLHEGNAFNFILTWLIARTQGGSILLRIDDLDAPRLRSAYLEDIFETLHWLGLDWDDGPQNATEHKKHFSQILRYDLYKSLIEKLIGSNKVFACTGSRKEIKENSINGQYTGKCRNNILSVFVNDLPLRLMTDDTISFEDAILGIQRICLPIEMKDPIIFRKESISAYQIASLADDIHFEINTIIRGIDLLPSTAFQIYIANLIGDNQFSKSTYYHHPLMQDDNGKKLSKSAGSLSIKAQREINSTPAILYKSFCNWLKIGESISSAEELLAYVKSTNNFGILSHKKSHL